MKVLVLNYEFPPLGGGAAPVTCELSRHLVQLSHQVDVVTMGYDNLPDFESRWGVNIYRTPALRRRPDICRTHEMATYLPGALPKVLQLARQKKYDIIHCHFIFPTGPLAWLTSRITGIPYLITCHGSDIPGYNPDRFTFQHKLLMHPWQFLVRQTPLLVAPSESLRNLILSQAPHARITVIPNGISCDFSPAPVKQNNILLCSRLLPRKGFQYALQAIKQMNLDWPVHIIGDGPYLAELKRLASDISASVTFWGWLDRSDSKFKNLFETSSVFIFPSEAENFPTVLLEALSAGLAIITTTAGGCPEVVGPAALLVEPQNPQAIRRELEKLIASENLRKQLSQAAQVQARKFNWPSVIQKYINCYKKITADT